MYIKVFVRKTREFSPPRSRLSSRVYVLYVSSPHQGDEVDHRPVDTGWYFLINSLDFLHTPSLQCRYPWHLAREKSECVADRLTDTSPWTKGCYYISKCNSKVELDVGTLPDVTKMRVTGANSVRDGRQSRTRTGWRKLLRNYDEDKKRKKEGKKTAAVSLGRFIEREGERTASSSKICFRGDSKANVYGE